MWQATYLTLYSTYMAHTVCTNDLLRLCRASMFLAKLKIRVANKEAAYLIFHLERSAASFPDKIAMSAAFTSEGICVNPLTTTKLLYSLLLLLFLFFHAVVVEARYGKSLSLSESVCVRVRPFFGCFCGHNTAKNKRFLLE